MCTKLFETTLDVLAGRFNARSYVSLDGVTCQSGSLAIRDRRLKQYILKRAAAAASATTAAAATTASRQVFLICSNLPIDLP